MAGGPGRPVGQRFAAAALVPELLLPAFVLSVDRAMPPCTLQPLLAGRMVPSLHSVPDPAP